MTSRVPRGKNRGRAVTAHSYARAGLMGNPSDAYGGKALALEIRKFGARVTVEPHDGVELVPHPADLPRFPSLQELAGHATRHGYHGGLRLLAAAAKAFHDHCAARSRPLESPGFRMSYQTDVPRQVGLAGSSAIVVAALKALFEFYGIESDPRTLPSLALRVETEELGIPAGLMDRVIQVWGGLVSMDLRDRAMSEIDGYPCGIYRALDEALLPPLYLAYGGRQAEPTEAVHGDLARRFRGRDPQVLSVMRELAALVDESLVALKAGDAQTLGALMDRNYELRRSVTRVAAGHAEMVRRARAAGASAKFTGSGGAIVGVLPDDDVLERLRSSLRTIGCEVVVLA